MPDSDVIPTLAYADVGEAVAWLCDKFGLGERLRIGDHRAQLSFGSGAVVVTQLPPGAARASHGHGLMVRVPDADRHHAHAAGRGARILHAPQSQPYGERQYTAEDLGGHVWTFSQTIADIDPATWGGVLVADASLRRHPSPAPDLSPP
jgi:uncharacterized glyoxalase superfamily protein PhnB